MKILCKVRLLDDRVSPDLLHQLLLTDHTAVTFDERDQGLNGLRREFDLFAASVEQLCSGIETKILELENPILGPITHLKLKFTIS